MTRVINGLGLGSFVFLFVSLFNQTAPTLTKESILSIFLVSICAGILSVLFDIERLNFLAALVIHFAGMNLVVWAASFFNGWLQGTTWMSYLGSMVIFYTCSWVFLVIRSKLITRELNQWIKQNSGRSQIKV
ncbi:DUF3021 domain-containing protein [Paenibacillus pasadenensis]|nr:DUF3021 domain-containing protein [Paenibacillus pasadenensis]